MVIVATTMVAVTRVQVAGVSLVQCGVILVRVIGAATVAFVTAE